VKKLWSITLVLIMLTVISCSKENKNITDPDDNNSNVSNIAFSVIPSGTFQMGDEVGDLESDCRPVHTVTLSGFEMSINEITNSQYAKFLNEAKETGDITSSNLSVEGAKGTLTGFQYIKLSGTSSLFLDARCWIIYSNNTFSVISGHEDWPVVWVTWYGAKAFAVYYGLDLPTEAEWEYACRGGLQFEYGTNDGLLNTGKANYWDLDIKHPVEVGSYPANPYGLFDMSGNVFEWCHDWYDTYSSESITNPSGVQTGSNRVVRGGGWSGYGFYCRSANRHGTNTFYYYGYCDIGFRVVRRPGGVIY
jgi:formylglycine-generating enzyme